VSPLPPPTRVTASPHRPSFDGNNKIHCRTRPLPPSSSATAVDSFRSPGSRSRARANIRPGSRVSPTNDRTYNLSPFSTAGTTSFILISSPAREYPRRLLRSRCNIKNRARYISARRASRPVNIGCVRFSELPELLLYMENTGNTKQTYIYIYVSAFFCYSIVNTLRNLIFEFITDIARSAARRSKICQSSLSIYFDSSFFRPRKSETRSGNGSIPAANLRRRTNARGKPPFYSRYADAAGRF